MRAQYLTLVSLLAFGNVASGDHRDVSVDKPPTGRKDHLGDALPAGTVARLGTTRFYHDEGINQMALSPDGASVAASGWHRLDELGQLTEQGLTIRLSEAASGREIRRLAIPGRVRGLSFSPDGKTLAAACGSQIVLWDVNTGNVRARLPHRPRASARPFQSYERGLVFLPGGKLLGCYLEPGWVIWDLASLRPVRELRPELTNDAKVSETSDWGELARAGTAIAWKVLRRTKRNNQPDQVAEFLEVVDGVSGKVRKRWQFPDAQNPPKRILALSADGKSVVVADDHITRWDVDSGKKVREWPLVAASLALSLDDKILACVHIQRRRIYLWDLDSGRSIRTLNAPQNVDAIRFSTDGKTLAVSGGARIHLFDVGTGRDKTSLPGHREPVASVAFSADGRLLESASASVLCQWDTAGWKQRKQINLSADPSRAVNPWSDELDASIVLVTRAGDGSLQTRSLVDGWGPSKPVTDFGWQSRDRKTVVLFEKNHDNRLGIYRAATGRKVAEVTLSSDRNGPVHFAADGSYLAWAGRRGNVCLADLATARVREIFTPPAGPYRQQLRLAFSGDGATLASIGVRYGPDFLRLWHTATGKEIQRINVTLGSTSPALAPDGRTVALGFRDSREIHLIEAASGRERARLPGHAAGVRSLSFSPNGAYLASSSDDGTILIWDMRNPLGLNVAGLTAGQLPGLWEDLAGLDAGRAFTAMLILAHNPKRSIPFLQQRLRPISESAPARIDRLIADLGAGRFAIRSQAARELEEMEEQALAALTRALAGKPPLETRQRLLALLHKLNSFVPPAQTLRRLRSIETLKLVASAEARRLLEELARGAPAARTTREAAAALRRLP